MIIYIPHPSQLLSFIHHTLLSYNHLYTTPFPVIIIYIPHPSQLLSFIYHTLPSDYHLYTTPFPVIIIYTPHPFQLLSFIHHTFIHSSFLIVFFLILKITLDLNIWWSVPQFAPRIVRVLQMSILYRHLVMMKSIICPCRERGCVQVVLCASFCLNMVLVTIISNSK